MKKVSIPNEWELTYTRRGKKQNMEKAMRGDIRRGLVELITNSDDSYRELEENYPSQRNKLGKIRIEITRRHNQPSLVVVRDKAFGMSREELYKKIGHIGDRTSGFEEGKLRRGLHGRGAKDLAAFGTVSFESIKDNLYNHLIISPSTDCKFKNKKPRNADESVREKLGIKRGNGTVVTIEVDNRFKIPQHDKLLTDFSRYYSLRDIFSNKLREVILLDVNKNREDKLSYDIAPYSKKAFESSFSIPDYPEAEANLIIYQYQEFFENDQLPRREGILVKSGVTIHDCTYFRFESDPFAWRFRGELRCNYIDKLVLEYDDLEELNPNKPNHSVANPIRILDPDRDGLIGEHPFVSNLYNKCRSIFKSCLDDLKKSEEKPKHKVANEDLQNKLKQLSKEISKVFETKLIDLEEEIIDLDGNRGKFDKMGLGIHFIPFGDPFPIFKDIPKTFSILVKDKDTLDEDLPIYLTNTNDNIKISDKVIPFRKLFEDTKIGSSTFKVESSTVGEETIIEARYNGFSELIQLKVEGLKSDGNIPDGLTFEKDRYNVRLGKEKEILIRLRTKKIIGGNIICKVSSDKPQDIIIKSGGRINLKAGQNQYEFFGKCKVLGRQLNAVADLTANVKGFDAAKTKVKVVEKESNSKFKFNFEPVEEDYKSVRYKWDDKRPNYLLIGAKHPAIRRYIGELMDDGYTGINSSLYYTVIAEIISEALAFRLLESIFKKEGQGGLLDFASTDSYYHKHFSDFLNIAHKFLSSSL
jgi:hypothetical protein